MAGRKSNTVHKDTFMENTESDSCATAISEIATTSTMEVPSIINRQVDEYSDSTGNKKGGLGILATGESVDQKFVQSQVNAVARDQFHIENALFLTTPSVDIQNTWKQTNVKAETSEETVKFIKYFVEKNGLIEADGQKTSGTSSEINEKDLANPPVGKGWVSLNGKFHYNREKSFREGGRVFEGKQKLPTSWRDVAVKIIAYNETNHKEIEEIKHLIALGPHPNVVVMHDADVNLKETIRFIYIVMEKSNSTLSKFINENQNKPLEEPEYRKRCSYAQQIVNGVAFIHRKGIMHRDIKPDNVLIFPEDNCRISDFGLSKQVLKGKSGATLSSQTTFTEGFEAPEVHNDLPYYSVHSDSFSIGIVISMIFSHGAHPYGSNSKRHRVDIMDDKPRDYTHVKRCMKPYPKKLEQLLGLIKKLLSHKPEDRPKPAEMLKDPFFKDDPYLLKHFEEDPDGIRKGSVQSDCCQEDNDNKPSSKNTVVNTETTPKEPYSLHGRHDLSVTSKRTYPPHFGKGENTSAEKAPKLIVKESGHSMDKAEPIRDGQESGEAAQQGQEPRVEHPRTVNRQCEEDVSTFEGWPELNQMNIHSEILHSALASENYLERMCVGLASKTSTPQVKKFLRECGLIDEHTIGDIEKEWNEESEKRIQLLNAMRTRQGLQLNPRKLIQKARDFREQEIYGILCKSFIYCLQS